MKTMFLAFSLVLTLFAAQYADAGNWTIDKAHTTVKFKVNHLLTSVWGEFKEYTVDLNYNTEDPTASTVRVEIDVNSIDTGVEKRDNHLRSADFFNVEEFPTMTFVSKEVQPMGDHKLRVIGDLTIRGETHSIELMVDGPSDLIEFMGRKKLAAHAESTINRTLWGLTWNRTVESGGVLVGEDVMLVIDVELDIAR